MKKALSVIVCVALMLSVVYTGAVTFSIPAKADGAKVLSEELVGYRRITAENILNNGTGLQQMKNDGDGDDSLLTLARSNMTMRYNGDFGGKTYLDADISFSTVSGDCSICYQSKLNEKYKDAFRFYKKNNATTFYLGYYNDSQQATELCTATVPSEGFFNLKLLTDVQRASSDATTETLYWQCWINDVYCADGVIEDVPKHDRYIYTTGMNSETSSITMRVPETNIIESFKGYKRVDMFDSNKTLTDGAVTLASGANAQLYVVDFDKTYLDVDVNYTAGGNLCYLAPNSDWNRCIYLFFNNVSNFRLGYYNTGGSDTGIAYQFDPSTFNAAPGEYFNMKVRIDIDAVDENLEDVKVQLWFNNLFVVEKTIRFDYTGAGPRSKSYMRNKNQSLTIKSSTDVDDQLENCKRVEPNDFENVVTTYDAAGCNTSDAHRGGSYIGNVSDLENCYLDIDVNEYISGSHQSPFLTWLSTGNASDPLYGTGCQLRFSVNGSNHLTILKTNSSRNGIATIDLGDISVDPYNYTAAQDQFFNLKVKTRIYGANSIMLLVFVNNKFFKSAYITDYDASMISGMNCLGMQKHVYRRTPIYDGILNDVDYDINEGNYVLYGDGLVVNGVSMSAGDEISERGGYVIERDNGVSKSFQRVSIYDGDAPQYKTHSLLLNDSIGVNFFMNLSGLTASEKAASYMTYSITHGKEEKKAEFNNGFTRESGYYGFTCPISSVQMAEKITPTFHYSVGGVSKTIVGETYSVKDYIDYVEENTEAFTENIVELVKSIGNYGYYAQVYFGAKNSWVAGTNYTALGAAYAVKSYSDMSYYSIDNDIFTKSLSASGITNGNSSGQFNYTLNFDTTTSIVIKFNTSDIKFTSIKQRGKDYTDRKNAYSTTQNTCMLYLLHLPISKLGDTITVEGEADGNEFTIEISGLTYIYGVLNKDGAASAFKNVASALYDYYMDAIEYANDIPLDRGLNAEWI